MLVGLSADAEESVARIRRFSNHQLDRVEGLGPANISCSRKNVGRKQMTHLRLAFFHRFRGFVLLGRRFGRSLTLDRDFGHIRLSLAVDDAILGL